MADEEIVLPPLALSINLLSLSFRAKLG